MLNWLVRYQPVMDILNEAGATSVLDVGSGWHGLARYWNKTVVQTDVRFVGEPLEGSEGCPTYVSATAEKLPFGDRSFDYVVSVDMMEHLSPELRQLVVPEMARVARRGMIVACPAGRAASVLDASIVVMCRAVGRSVPQWLREHRQQVSYPDKDTLIDALPSGWILSREIALTNILFGGADVVGEMFLPRIRLWSRLEARFQRRSVPRMFNAPPTIRSLFVATAAPEPAKTEATAAV